MVEVRIRHETDSKAQPFTTCDPNHLDDLMAIVRAWTVSVDGDPLDELSGQFVVDQTGAYFEIIVHEDEDEGEVKA